MSELSPAAQAVLDAYYTHADLLNRDVSHEEMLAAALRAAAEQLGYRILYDNDDIDHRVDVADLLAIAAELEGFSG